MRTFTRSLALLVAGMGMLALVSKTATAQQTAVITPTSVAFTVPAGTTLTVSEIQRAQKVLACMAPGDQAIQISHLLADNPGALAIDVRTLAAIDPGPCKGKQDFVPAAPVVTPPSGRRLEFELDAKRTYDEAQQLRVRRIVGQLVGTSANPEADFRRIAGANPLQAIPRLESWFQENGNLPGGLPADSVKYSQGSATCPITKVGQGVYVAKEFCIPQNFIVDKLFPGPTTYTLSWTNFTPPPPIAPVVAKKPHHCPGLVCRGIPVLVGLAALCLIDRFVGPHWVCGGKKAEEGNKTVGRPIPPPANGALVPSGRLALPAKMPAVATPQALVYKVKRFKNQR